MSYNAQGGIDVYVNCDIVIRKSIPCIFKTMATYTITELAKEFDITPRAIRFYEDQGLISPTREGPSGRNRVYTARERTHLKLTLRGKRLGLSLSDIKSLVDMYGSPKDTAVQLKSFLEVLARHRAALELQREDIEIMLAEIGAHEEESERLLALANTDASVSALK